MHALASLHAHAINACAYLIVLAATLPATPGPAPRRLVFFSITSTIKCITGSCNPIRLLKAAELLEADQRKQRKHEGGHNRETSSVLDSTSFGYVPRRLVLYRPFPKLRT